MDSMLQVEQNPQREREVSREKADDPERYRRPIDTPVPDLGPVTQTTELRIRRAGPPRAIHQPAGQQQQGAADERAAGCKQGQPAQAGPFQVDFVLGDRQYSVLKALS